MSIPNIPTRHPWLSLEPLSASEWLVTDEGQTVLTGDGVIGHILLFRGIYEVLRRSEPGARFLFDRLAGAIDSFAPGVDGGAADARPGTVSQGSKTAA